MSDTPWRTANEAARRVRCSRRVIQRAAKSGQLRSTRVAGRLLFLDEWIDAWTMAQSATTSTSITETDRRRSAVVHG